MAQNGRVFVTWLGGGLPELPGPRRGAHHGAAPHAADGICRSGRPGVRDAIQSFLFPTVGWRLAHHGYGKMSPRAPRVDHQFLLFA